MKRKCRPWTERDTERTIEMLAEGKGLNAIGLALGRSHHTVRSNMAKVPGYKSRGRGRPKGNKCPRIYVRAEAETVIGSLAKRMLSVSLRVSA